MSLPRVRRGGQTFLRYPLVGRDRTQARLTNASPREGLGRSVPPRGLVTSSFSRCRCKGSAPRVAAGLCIDADDAGRRAESSTTRTMLSTDDPQQERDGTDDFTQPNRSDSTPSTRCYHVSIDASMLAFSVWGGLDD